MTRQNKQTTVRCALALSLALPLLFVSAFAQETSTRKIVKRVAAQYPSVLRQRGIGGVVKLRVLITAGGTVKDAQVTGGNAILADCAQKAVKQWLFAPAGADSYMEISVVFDPNAPQD